MHLTCLIDEIEWNYSQMQFLTNLTIVGIISFGPCILRVSRIPQ